MITRALLADGSFTIEGPEGILAPWLPSHAAAAPRAKAHLVIEPAPLGVAALSMSPTLSLLEVGAWVDGDGVLLRSKDARLDGILELAGPGGTLGVVAGTEVEPLLTIATALLLGRLGRALVHAAAVVASDGRVWLLAGDTHAGKSTTVATLVRGGWSWLADDQVILRREGDGLVVEGWPRPPNLDAGYAQARVTGARLGVTFAEFGAAPLAGKHPLGGLLLPRIEARQATATRAATSADAFAALVRQSPWLLADPAAAPTILSLLQRAAELPVAELILGEDSYGRPAALIAALRPLVERR